MTEEEICQAYKSGGHSLKTLAAAAGLSAGGVRNILLRHGVALRRRGSHAGHRRLTKRFGWQEQMAERNARALAEGRARVYTPEERAELQAKMLGGSK